MTKILEPGYSHLVGIGASAGGIEAIERFFTNIPLKSGLAYIIIQHLDHSQNDVMPALINRFTDIKTTQAKNGMKVKPDNIYIIPPNKNLSVLNGTLHLFEPVEPRGLRLPIDFFFKQLADDQKEKAIGIILSGMGSDGTQGIKAIKEKMGLVMVQEPDSAKFNSMPLSARNTDLVDIIDTPEKLAQRLEIYSRNKPVFNKEIVLDTKKNSIMDKIVIMIRTHTGHDFSQYKKNTIYRRIERRMAIHLIEKISDYASFLQSNNNELNILFNEILICVTRFFRDPEAFDVLKQNVLPSALAKPCENNEFRVWIPGCATGEEAYSIAIIINELLDELNLKNNLKVQIFATDLSTKAINKARLGVYAANITTDVSPQRIKRYFTKNGDNYRISNEIRDMVIFATQNIAMDPPFTKQNFISCRNLLIYLNSDLQKKLISIFYYSLLQKGILFLGSSESIAVYNDLFGTIDTKNKIFFKEETAKVERLSINFTPKGTIQDIEIPLSNSRINTDDNFRKLIENYLLQKFVPPSVLVDKSGNIQYIIGRTGKYLEPTEGKAIMNIFFMAREGLKSDLVNAIQQAANNDKQVVKEKVKVKTNGVYEFINITVIPVSENDSINGLFFVSFQETDMNEIKPKRSNKKINPEIIKNERIIELETQLKESKDYMQSIIEEMQTSQEELKSVNEELQSTNEEMQSTNEELTTSKEEMQSMNEELMSLNSELQEKIEELYNTNNDMKNLLNSTNIATLFLDNNLRIRRYTDQATKIFKFIHTDIGRHISDINSELKYDFLVSDINEVLRTLVYQEFRVQIKTGSWYHLKIMPYRSLNNLIDGVVVVFNDISPIIKIEELVQEKESQISELKLRLNRRKAKSNG